MNEPAGNTLCEGGTDVFETVLVEHDTRFPNLVIAADGSIVLTHGGTPAVPPPPRQRLVSRRSADGGATWESPEVIREPALPGGGMLVDEQSGAILCFSHASHPHPHRPQPPFPAQVHRSDDHGRTWPVKRRLFDGPSIYSSLVAGRPGTASEGWLYCAFEGGTKMYESVRVVRFTLAWLLAGEGMKSENGKTP